MTDDKQKRPDGSEVIARGPKCDQAPGPFAKEVGDVAYMASFIGGVVIHTEEEAYQAAEAFRHLAPVAIFRIEVVDVLEKTEQKA
jgi:hypothetical protein